ncbi:MAG: DUF4956 domain-containing protein [Defluviitaleaceae bacterium]|nr:DUF4956 domain-containing protein [Defluviitaleaceae bacterium]
MDFSTLFTGMYGEGLTMQILLMNTFSAIFFGVVVSCVYMFRNNHSRTMALTLVVLPALVQMIIVLVSGNIGAGVAVAGAFSLVRFRSATGSARDIGFLFFAMVLGFVTGMGYLLYAFVLLLIIGVVFLILAIIPHRNRQFLKIVIPENLDFHGLFDEVFAKYTTEQTLEKVKTTNMGSLYELSFTIRLKANAKEREFIDEIRILNGNLNIYLSREVMDGGDL